MKLKHLFVGMLALAAFISCSEEDHYMTLSEKKLTVGEDGGSISVDLSANVYYRVVNNNDFVTIEAASKQASTTTYLINVQPNPDLEARSARIKFIGDYVTPLAFDIVQSGKVPVGVSVDEITIKAEETGTSFIILGEKAWTAVCDNPDFVLSATSGVGETRVNVTCPSNTEEREITATVTVTINGEKFYVKIIQRAFLKEKIDISADGPSNCYIITEPDGYRFKATVRGNGYLPESCTGELTADIKPSSAGLLWCSYNTATAPAADEIISDVALKGDYIEFKTKLEGVSANAVIAAYDEAGKILWSWHIWITDDPKTSEIGGANWMDRNLGATCANIKADARSIGLLYQWGRKDPMRSASDYENDDFIATYPAFTADEINVDENTTIATSIENPTVFINTYPGGAGPKDWVFAANHEDRWMDEKKTMFDPCPVGYKVPSNAQWCAFAEAAGLPSGSTKYSKNEACKAAYNGTEHVFETSMWSLPLGGILSYNDGTKFVDCGVTGRYESSTATTSPSAFYLNANGTACNFSNAATRGHAGAMRCVKE